MKSNYLLFLTLLFVLLIAGCSKSDNETVSNTNSSSADTNGDTGTETDHEIPVEPWAVSETGTGPVEIGMTVAEASQALGVELTDVESGDSCHYVKPQSGPSGISLMVVDGRIARVDVDDPSIVTSVGAQVGDSEERIRMLYMNQVEVTPHKYTDGHYLTVIPTNNQGRIIFETDGEKVTRFRAGKMPEVEWVEGCS